MTWQFANPLLLLGLLGASIPILIHLLNRRRSEVIDWGAMQFLEIGRRARRRIELTDLLLMAGRMVILAAVALAVARPFLAPRPAQADAAGRASGAASRPRDLVLILDGSESMDRRAGGTTPRDRAAAWAESHVRQLPPGSSVSVLLARGRVRPLVDALSFDGKRVLDALRSAPASRGSADLPAAIAEALRRLEAGRNAERDIIILTDGRRRPWRLDEPRRWDLIRRLHADFARRLGARPQIVAVDARPDAEPAGADGQVGPPGLPRGLVPPLLPLTVRSVVHNAGPGPLTRTAELLIDGKPAPGSSQVVGPVPPGGSTPLTFRAAIAEPGSHALAVRLAPTDDDPLPSNDESARPVEVVPALPVLLIDGEPGREPLSGETDFLRAALVPTGDDTPQVAATVVPLADFTPEALRGRKAVVLANAERLTAPQASALAAFVAQGGGLLVAPGDRTDPDSANDQAFRSGQGWLPARLGPWRGDPSARQAVAHPAPPTFNGPSLAPFAAGEAPPLADADLFAYCVLEPATTAPPAAVLARLDTGDPWLVERPYRQGRVMLAAGPLDAEGGTLPVNPDFVPLMHELVYHLADPAAAGATVRPGEPLTVPLEGGPDPSVATVPVVTPSGETRTAAVRREGQPAPRAVLEATDEPGLYRFTLPSGEPRYAAVTPDPREADPSRLSPADRARLADGWPLAFERDPARLAARLSAPRTGPRPLWRGLVLAALAGLCLEVLLTRRMARTRGLAPADEPA